MADNENLGPDLVVLKFADSKIPEFKEVRNRDFILYGEDNLYPEYLTYLYNKSAKHGAIINGKCNYIFGGGLKRKSDGESWGKVNRSGETMDDVLKKSIKDIEIYGGFRWMVIWDVVGRISDIFHIDFFKIRSGKEKGEFFYKEDWTDNKEKEITPYLEFNTENKKGAQIFEYNEYRPGCKRYPLPGYVASNNYIETDIEISKYNLSCIRNGMMPSKMIQVYTGNSNVTEEHKRELEKRWSKKFTGSENGGRFILVWSPSKEKSLEITDLSATESDKLFDQLNKTCQQEIFTGHQVVSPMLFGIKSEGQLGGTNELKVAYEIFINTYAKPKQQDIEKVANYFGTVLGRGSDYYIEQVDPIGLQIDIASVIEKLPSRFIFEKLNIPKEYWPTEISTSPEEQLESEGGSVNENLKTLTAKQHQQLLRVVRDYSKGRITRAAAISMLKSGYGLTDADVEAWLGADESQKFAKEISEDEIIQLFAESGEAKANYHIVKSKPVKFENDEQALDDEMDFFEQAFYTSKISDADILELISKDKKITPEVIAKALNATPEQITTKIASLVKKGVISTTEVNIGEDVQTERTLTKPLKEIIKTIGDGSTPTEISIKYSYDGPQDSRNRPFCAKLMSLGRLYSRYEIEQISQRLGYSVFDRRGGFWTHSAGYTTPYCRHRWSSVVVVKKGDKA